MAIDSKKYDRRQNIKKGINDFSWKVYDTLLKGVAVVGLDGLVSTPQFEKYHLQLGQDTYGLSVGLDVAVLSGWVASEEDKTGLGLAGLVASTIPDWVAMAQDGQVGVHGTSIALKGIAAGVAHGGAKLIKKGYEFITSIEMVTNKEYKEMMEEEKKMRNRQ